MGSSVFRRVSVASPVLNRAFDGCGARYDAGMIFWVCFGNSSPVRRKKVFCGAEWIY